MSLFPQLARQVVEVSLVRERLAAATAYRQAVERLLGYLDGQFLEGLKLALAEQFKNKDVRDRLELVMVGLNVIRVVVDQLSRVYDEPAQRTIVQANGEPVGETLQDQYQAWLDATDLDGAVRDAHRKATLVGVAAVKPTVRRTGDASPLADYWAVDVWTPDSFWVSAVDYDPLVAAALLTERIDTDDATVIRRYQEGWTSDTIYTRTIEGVRAQAVAHGQIPQAGVFDKQNEYGPNPYGVVPVVFWWDKRPSGAVLPCLDEHLMRAQAALDVQMTNLIHVIKHQSFSRLVLKGDAGKQVNDPSAPLQLHDKKSQPDFPPDAYYITPAPLLDQVLTAVNDFIDATLASYGIKPDAFRQKEQASSGYALKLMDREMERVRKRKAQMARRYERQLFELLRLMAPHEKAAAVPFPDLPKGAWLKIDFVEPDYPDDPSTAYNLRRQMVSDGVLHQTALVRDVNPDLSPGDAENELQKNRKFLQANPLPGGAGSGAGTGDILGFLNNGGA